jgi:hypothetical protein
MAVLERDGSREMSELRRAQQRVSAVLPVKVEGKTAGVTRDISPAGIFFETDLDMADGAAIHFSLEFDNPSGKLLLECSGQIVRIERAGGKIGVAARIVESRLERCN